MCTLCSFLQMVSHYSTDLQVAVTHQDVQKNEPAKAVKKKTASK